MVGQTLGHYKIVEKLGAGGMGEVWRLSAPRPRLGRLKLWMTLGAAGLVLAAGLATSYWALRPTGEQDEVPTEPLIGRFSKLTMDLELEMEPSLSPNGRFFVYASDAAGNWDIYLQRIGVARPSS